MKHLSVYRLKRIMYFSCKHGFAAVVKLLFHQEVELNETFQETLKESGLTPVQIASEYSVKLAIRIFRFRMKRELFYLYQKNPFVFLYTPKTSEPYAICSSSIALISI